MPQNLAAKHGSTLAAPEESQGRHPPDGWRGL